MGLINVFPDAGIAQSQQNKVVEFWFVASAAGTKHVLAGVQRAASPRVYLMTGNGTIDMTVAEAAAITAPTSPSSYTPQSQNVVYSDGSITTLSQELQSSLVTYFTDIPAAADAANCVAFAVGGLDAATIICAELDIMSQSSAGINAVRRLRRITGHRDLVSRSKDAAQAALLTYGTDNLVTCQGVAFGSFSVPDVTDAPAAGELLKLSLYIQN